jgi:hypothetical protein
VNKTEFTINKLKIRYTLSMKKLLFTIFIILTFTACGELTKEQCAHKGLTWIKIKTVDKKTNKFIYKGYCKKKKVSGYL